MHEVPKRCTGRRSKMWFLARMGLIFITAVPTACGFCQSISYLPERQDRIKHIVLPFRQKFVCFCTAGYGCRLTCGYEDIAFQATSIFQLLSSNFYILQKNVLPLPTKL